VKLKLVITGVGMVTPIGLSAIECLHSVRSSITRLALQPYPDRINEWVVGGNAMTQTLEVREGRLRILAELALREARKQAFGVEPKQPVPVVVLLGAPESIRPGYRFPSPGFNFRTWLAGLGVRSSRTIEVLEAGHCGAHVALERAREILDSGEARACLIGAVDNQVQLRVIRWLEDYYRLKCRYMIDGLLPGEASCFLVVEDELSARDRGARILAQVLSVASDREAATVLSDQPNTARGLTNAVRTALKDAGVDSPDIDAVWCDLSGESYRAREWAFTEIRLKFQTHTELFHPADCHGDLGAASDANLLGLATMAQASGWARRRPLLVFAGSEGGIRAAAVVGPPPEDQPPTVLQVSEHRPVQYRTDLEVPALGPDEEDYRESEDPPRSYFEWELRQEHLGDLASLYYQRRAILRNGEVDWFRAREPEQRILNHLDAVVVSGATAIWAVASGILSDDEGSCFAGALILGLLANPKNLARIEGVLQDPSSTNLAGIEAGLRLAPPLVLRPWIDTLLTHDLPEVRAMVASLAGYRREGSPEKLFPLLQGREPSVIRAAAEALRRLRHLKAIPALEQLAEHEDPTVREAVLLSLLCLGSQPARNLLRQLCRGGCPPGFHGPILLALCGNIADLPLLLQAGEQGSMDLDTIEAIGLLGNVRGVPPLLQVLQLEDESLKIASAEALERMTAAGIREKVVVVEEAEGPDADVSGQPKREVERVSTSHREWSLWWTRNAFFFEPTRRWRHGQPFDLEGCLAEMADGKGRVQDRRRSHYELVIQSGHDIPFEPDDFVFYQQAAIERWRIWLERTQGHRAP
jgi:3-oxoacyl-[acyl-carrier-protein] synthase-1